MLNANNSLLYHIRWVWSGISCKNVADIRWLGDRNMICQIYVICEKSFFAKSCSPFNLYPVRNYVKSHMDEKNWDEQ